MAINISSVMRTNGYNGHEQRVISVQEYSDVTGGEVEDLLPSDVLAKVMDRILRNANTDEDFSDTLDDSLPNCTDGQVFLRSSG